MKPIITLSPFLTLSSGHQVDHPGFINGMPSTIKLSPRFLTNSLSTTLPFITGTISDSLIQNYTLTPSNALGESSVEFTLAIDNCPQGLQLITILINLNNAYGR